MRFIPLLLLLAFPTQAQEPAWPREFVRIIDEAESYCFGTFTVAPEAASQRDLNGDRRLDWVFDASGFACSDSRVLTAPDDTGGTVRFLWTGSEWQQQ